MTETTEAAKENKPTSSTSAATNSIKISSETQKTVAHEQSNPQKTEDTLKNDEADNATTAKVKLNESAELKTDDTNDNNAITENTTSTAEPLPRQILEDKRIQLLSNFEYRISDENLRERLMNLLKERNACSVLVRRLPGGIKVVRNLYHIANVAQAVRRLDDFELFTPQDRIVFEFSTKLEARQWVDRLNRSVYEKKELTATRGKFLSEEIDEYCFHELIVLNYAKEMKQKQMTDLIQADAVYFSQQNHPQSYIRARFPSINAALAAYHRLQGYKYDGVKLSVMFKRFESSLARQSRKRHLLISGPIDKITEADLRNFYPQFSQFDRDETNGKLRLIYDTKNACISDYQQHKWFMFNDQKFETKIFSVLRQRTSRPKRYDVNPLSINAHNLPETVKVSELQAAFPKAKEIILNMVHKSAVLQFETKEEADAVLEDDGDLFLAGSSSRVVLQHTVDPNATNADEKPTEVVDLDFSADAYEEEDKAEGPVPLLPDDDGKKQFQFKAVVEEDQKAATSRKRKAPKTAAEEPKKAKQPAQKETAKKQDKSASSKQSRGPPQRLPPPAFIAPFPLMPPIGIPNHNFVDHNHGSGWGRIPPPDNRYLRGAWPDRPGYHRERDYDMDMRRPSYAMPRRGESEHRRQPRSYEEYSPPRDTMGSSYRDYRSRNNWSPTYR